MPTLVREGRVFDHVTLQGAKNQMSSALLTEVPTPAPDRRNGFLGFVAVVWFAVLTGFGLDSLSHISRHGLDYPAIVHAHAIVFVTWLVLFTAQVALVRSRRTGLHRKLGVAGAALAIVMIILGPVTALVVASSNYASRGETPEFLAIEFMDVIAFGCLTGAGLLLRGTTAHKRLMLLGLIYLSTPGFARFLNIVLGIAVGAIIPLGHGFWRSCVSIFIGTDLLLVGLGIYDLMTSRRLYPSYGWGAGFVLLCQFTALNLLFSPAWKAFSLTLIGH